MSHELRAAPQSQVTLGLSGNQGAIRQQIEGEASEETRPDGLSPAAQQRHHLYPEDHLPSKTCLSLPSRICFSPFLVLNATQGWSTSSPPER